MAVKANLSIQLLADTVVVAESDDQELWRKVFAAIQTGNPLADPADQNDYSTKTRLHSRAASTPVASFAAELGISEEEVIGACDPVKEAPYINLDQRYWEALRNRTGSRGPDAIAPIALAATLLALWFKYGQIGGAPTVQQCQEVLAAIGVRDQNAARSLRNTAWLQTRNGAIQINPAQWSRALRIAKAFCMKKSPKEMQVDSSE